MSLLWKAILGRVNRRAFDFPGAAYIAMISWMHVSQAIFVHLDSRAADFQHLHGATDLIAIFLAFHYFGWDIDATFLQALICCASSLAVVGVVFSVGWVRLATFVPQHLVLGAMGWGGVLAAWQGHYLDGTPMSWGHIGADQIGYITLFIIHSYAIWRRCRWQDE
jgi:hypothetical protein